MSNITFIYGKKTMILKKYALVAENVAARKISFYPL